MALNPYQLAQLAYDAGFNKSSDELTIAVATALGESGGVPTKVGDSGNSYGLWQIHLPSHPEYRGNPQALFDPKTNAAAAYKIYVAAGRNWEPFHAWSHASTAKQLSLRAVAGPAVVLWQASHPGAAFGIAGREQVEAGKDIAGAATGALAPGVKEAVEGFNKARDWITTPANVGRLAYGIVGAVIIVIGLAVLAKPAVDQAAKIASAVK